MSAPVTPAAGAQAPTLATPAPTTQGDALPAVEAAELTAEHVAEIDASPDAGIRDKPTDDPDSQQLQAETAMDASSSDMFTGDLSDLVSNTPTKTRSKADVWSDIRRLPHALRGSFGKKTHVCVVQNKDGAACRMLIRLSKQPAAGDKSGAARLWQTNIANQHVRLFHGTSSKAGEASMKRKLDEEMRKETVMFKQGMNQTSGSATSVATDLRKYSLSREERALTSQARWYMYSKMHISKQEFESVEFREMQREQAGGVSVLLSRRQLTEYVRAEFRIFVKFLQFIIAQKMVQAKGNPFAQGIHDGGTLANHQKYQALGIQFIPASGEANFVICIGLKRSFTGTNASVAELFKAVCLERTGFSLPDLVGNAISDRAAKGVQGELGLHEEVCQMHDADKLGASAIGNLVRTRQKQVVNPFPEGQRIYKLAHKMGTHFSYGERTNKLHACAEGIDVPQPTIKIQVDLNETRVAAQHGLFFSELRLNRLLRVYQIKHAPDWTLTEADWQGIAEIEAVLDITRTLTTLVQEEKSFVGAYGPLLRAMTLRRLRDGQLMVVDMASISTNPTLERKAIPVDALTEVGRTARYRATLEAERRFGVNTSEEVNGARITYTDRELTSMLLDIRTVRCKGALTLAEYQVAQGTLEREYVRFGVTALKYDQQQESKSKADAAARAGLTQKNKKAKYERLESGFQYNDDSSSSGSDSAVEDEYNKAMAPVNLEELLRGEFGKAFKAYRKIKIDWHSEFPELVQAQAVRPVQDLTPQGEGGDVRPSNEEEASKRPLDLVADLMKLPVGKLFKKLIDQDPLRRQFGWLPLMALASKGQVGALMAESFCERILSCANLVMTEGNTLLGDEELEMMVVLRMNKQFMAHMREHYNNLSCQDFGNTVVRSS